MNRILIYTVHKAASMLLHRLARDVTFEADLPHLSINDDACREEIINHGWPAIIDQHRGSGCFGPIRATVEDAIFPDRLHEYSILLHLRDPRDALTSLFYSHTFSHTRRPGGFNPADALRRRWEADGIDRFVLEKMPRYKKAYESLLSTLVNRENTTLIRYEDMVTDFAGWLDAFLSSFGDFDAANERNSGICSLLPGRQSGGNIRGRLYKKYQSELKFPRKERIYSYKRQVRPGNHRQKLAPETIAILNHALRDILTSLSYV